MNTYNVLEYLEEAAQRFPSRKAVSLKDSSYTFQELRDQSRRIGANLIERFGPEGGKPVLIMAEQGIETAVYFLGVLYSGNFYVPADPQTPEHKLQAIMEDCEPIAVLGSEESFTKVRQSGWNGMCLTVDKIPEGVCSIPDKGGDDPLYLIYTSGSTGTPKGVLKSHRQEISFLEAYCRTFSFTPDDIIGNQTPFFFDASAKDFYMMLKLGCTLEILPAALFSLPPELIDYLNDKKVTFISWVPTALSLVAQLNPFSLVKPHTLKRVAFVGEVMPMKHLNRWREALPDLSYINLYGQTEIAGICAYYEVTGQYGDQEVLPIGKALSNCRLFLCTQDRIIREPDQIGEICIVSDALATGYYRREDLTDRSFVIRDFGEGPVRCFRTGDLASYNQEGDLVFAARSDYQIKHMGHRIELGEIEAVAGALPEIDRCCCLYQESKRKIVLFCQLISGCEAEPMQIHAALREQLTSYMLPGKVILKESLPLNASGKIDRMALKALL